MWKGAGSCIGSLCAFLMACGGSPPAQDRIETLKRALDTALFECPDRAWPGTGARYRGSQVLLVSAEAGMAYLWNDQRVASTGQSPPLSRVEFADLGPEWLAVYNRGMLFGVPTLGISLDDAARINELRAAAGQPSWHDYAVELTLHEAFHIIGSQPSWRAVGGGTRSIPYPQTAGPRYLRAALASSLLAHVRDRGGDAALAAAAFWQGRFVTEHAADAAAIRDTDINEGAAEYATLVGSALVERGCAASEAALVETMLAHLDEFVNVTWFDGGSEPYQLGALAGLGARIRDAGVAGWEARVESGQTPVEVLIGGTGAVSQTDDPNLSAGAQAVVDARNAASAAEVTPLLARMSATDHVRLPLPPEWTVGSFTVAGFLQLVDEPGTPEVLLRYRGTHQVPGTGPTITVDQTVMRVRPEACGTPAPAMLVATFPAAAVVTDATAGLVTVNSAEVSFTGLPTTPVQDAAGLTWMCHPPAATAPAALVAYPADAARRAFKPLDCERPRLSLR